MTTQRDIGQIFTTVFKHSDTIHSARCKIIGIKLYGDKNSITESYTFLVTLDNSTCDDEAQLTDYTFEYESKNIDNPDDSEYVLTDDFDNKLTVNSLGVFGLRNLNGSISDFINKLKTT